MIEMKKKFFYSLLAVKLDTNCISTIWIVDYWCFIPLLSILQLLCGGHFVLLEKTGTLGQILPQVIDKLYQIRLYQVHLTVIRNLTQKCFFLDIIPTFMCTPGVKSWDGVTFGVLMPLKTKKEYSSKEFVSNIMMTIKVVIQGWIMTIKVQILVELLLLMSEF